MVDCLFSFSTNQKYVVLVVKLFIQKMFTMEHVFTYRNILFSLLYKCVLTKLLMTRSVFVFTNENMFVSCYKNVYSQKNAHEVFVYYHMQESGSLSEAGRRKRHTAGQSRREPTCRLTE